MSADDATAAASQPPAADPAPAAAATTTSTATTTTTAATTTTSTSATDALAAKTSTLSLGDADGDGEAAIIPVAALAEELKDHLNIVFVGHVDAGKSTLCGQVLYQTGQVDQRTIEKLEQQAKDKKMGSWFLAYVMDAIEEEKEKGKTIEVGRALFETTVRRYTILDAPGHKAYVPNMIGGASQADVAILVVSARKGEFEAGFEKGGQTCEHAILCKTLGVRQLVVVINKMDESTVQWSQARYDEIVTKLSAFLKTAGYNVKADVQFLPISSYTGLNVKEPMPADVAPFYTGKSLLGTLDDIKPPARNPTGPLRMPIIDKYKDRGLTFMLGKVEMGTVEKDMKAVLMPNKVPVRVASLGTEVHEMAKAGPGENIRVGVAGIEESALTNGTVLCDAANPLVPVAEFEAQIVLLELPAGKHLLSAGYQAVIHIHTAVEEITVSAIVSEIDKKTKKPGKKPPAFVRAGAIFFARIQPAQPLCIETFDACPQLGRFTLRDETKTIAVGKVTAIVKKAE